MAPVAPPSTPGEPWTPPLAPTPSPLIQPPSITEQERLRIRAVRKQSMEALEAQLLELSKLESVPESDWPLYHYPSHYTPVLVPAPTALQRIAVSKYWNVESCYIGASVGAGKTRIVIDSLNLSALAPTTSEELSQNVPRIVPQSENPPPLFPKSRSFNVKVTPDLPISVAVTLIIAPLSLHTNWMREFEKWTPPDSPVQWRIHKYQNSLHNFWIPAERSFSELFDHDPRPPGGLVIITTPQSLARTNFLAQFIEHNCHPTCIIVDEGHLCFRTHHNKTYRVLLQLVKQAHRLIMMSGTPIARFHDWWAIYNLLSKGQISGQWRNGMATDFERASDPGSFSSSGLCEPEWSHKQLLKEFHKWRIEDGRVTLFLKEHYMRDALPSQDSCDLGPFADVRPSLDSILEEYPKLVEAAVDLQNTLNPGSLGSMHSEFMVQTLVLRMQQLASTSPTNHALLSQFIGDFLEPDESLVIWCLFHDEINAMVNYLKQKYPSCSTKYLHGDIKPEWRQHALDSFASGEARFLVVQAQMGVGFNLTRASKDFYNTIPIGYLALSQCHGRIHRLGQDRDVTHYNCLTHPVNAWALSLYERRKEIAEDLHLDIGKLKSFAKQYQLNTN